MTSRPRTTTDAPRRRAPSAHPAPLLRPLVAPALISLLQTLLHSPRLAVSLQSQHAWSTSPWPSLVASSLALIGLFQLARRAANERVAWASVACTALYGVFYEASASASSRDDMAATALLLWAIFFYLAARPKQSRAKDGDGPERATLWPLLACVALFVLAVLAKETTFGAGAWSWSRAFEATGERAWQALGQAGLYCLSAAMLLLTLLAKPLSDEGVERGRINVKVQLIFAAVAVCYGIRLSLTSEAGRASQMLPVVPLVILVSVSTIWRRMKYWAVFVALVCAAFVLLW